MRGAGRQDGDSGSQQQCCLVTEAVPAVLVCCKKATVASCGDVERMRVLEGNQLCVLI